LECLGLFVPHVIRIVLLLADELGFATEVHQELTLVRALLLHYEVCALDRFQHSSLHQLPPVLKMPKIDGLWDVVVPAVAVLMNAVKQEVKLVLLSEHQAAVLRHQGQLRSYLFLRHRSLQLGGRPVLL